MQTPILFRLLSVLAVVSLAGNAFWNRPGAIAVEQSKPGVIGTWKGDSTCTGVRPACKNEVVVYRFEAVAGRPDAILWFADKTIDGKREPMGKAEMQYDAARSELTWEFAIQGNHSRWQLKFSGDTMEGTLILLPNRDVARVVKVKRVNEKDVPPAPARELYDEP